MSVTGGELVGAQALPKGFNAFRFDPSKYDSFPESQNRRRKSAIARIAKKEFSRLERAIGPKAALDKLARNEEKRQASIQIGANAFLQLNSAVPIRPIGLGAATWAGGVYAYAPDYSGFVNGDPITTTLIPRVGAGVLTPANSSGLSANNPLYMSAGIGGRGAFNFQATTNSCFALDWIVGLMDGVDKPCSIFCRGLRTSNESGVSFGFGSNSTTDRWMRLGHSAAGDLQTAKDGSGASSATLTSTQNLGFSVGTWCVTTNGVTASLYYNGSPTNIVNGALQTTTTNPLVHANWGTSGQSAVGTDDFGGIQSFVGVTPLVLSAAQVGELDDFLIAQDVPPAVGTPCMHAGDSIARASGSGGYRKQLWEWYTDPLVDLSLDWQGPVSSGAFLDNQCNAFSGITIAQMRSNLLGNIGSGKPYSTIQTIHLLIGSNDCVGGYNGATVAAAYAALLADVYAQAIVTVPSFRWICGTVTPKDGANNAYVADLWTRLMGSGGVFDTWDAAHPTSPIVRVDYFNCFGGVWNSSDFIDAVHPNYAGGYTKMAQDPTYGLIASAGAYLATISL